jgi:hypothetical protein
VERPWAKSLHLALNGALGLTLAGVGWSGWQVVQKYLPSGSGAGHQRLEASSRHLLTGLGTLMEGGEAKEDGNGRIDYSG